MQKRHIISGILVLLIILLGVTYAAFDRGVLALKDGALVFSKEAITNPIPKLGRVPQFPVDFSPEARDIYERNMTSLTETLGSDPTNANAWLDVAIYYRMAGDTAGALEVWEYLRNAYPSDGISRHNLAEHYFHTTKEYGKAEQLYRESITVAPAIESNYTDLYEMYRYAYKQDTSAAIDILLEAIENTGDVSQIQFQIMLGRHYRDVLGDKENARTHLTTARDAAAARGDSAIATELSRELSSL